MVYGCYLVGVRALLHRPCRARAACDGVTTVMYYVLIFIGDQGRTSSSRPSTACWNVTEFSALCLLYTYSTCRAIEVSCEGGV